VAVGLLIVLPLGRGLSHTPGRARSKTRSERLDDRRAGPVPAQLRTRPAGSHRGPNTHRCGECRRGRVPGGLLATVLSGFGPLSRSGDPTNGFHYWERTVLRPAGRVAAASGAINGPGRAGRAPARRGTESVVRTHARRGPSASTQADRLGAGSTGSGRPGSRAGGATLTRIRPRSSYRAWRRFVDVSTGGHRVARNWPTGRRERDADIPDRMWRALYRPRSGQ
jgi:hypothetical protein